MESKIPNIKIAQIINWKKISDDLSSIKRWKEFTMDRKWRIVVCGGYGLDFFLNITTRTHDDINLIIYGRDPKNSALYTIKEFADKMFSGIKIDSSVGIFYSEITLKIPGYAANIYYVETNEDPFANHLTTRTIEGKQTGQHPLFNKPLHGRIGDLEIEIQDQNLHLANILKNCKDANMPPKYNQDIENLKHITDQRKVEEFLTVWQQPHSD